MPTVVCPSYSAFSSKIVKLRAAPYGGGTGDWADIDDVRVMKWLAQQYNLRVKASHVIEAVSVVAHDHPDIRRVFEGFHFETLDIRYCNTNQRQGND